MNRNDNNERGMNGLGAAMVGAAVGAAAVILSDKDKRERLKTKYNELMQKGEKSVNRTKEVVDDAKEEGKKKVASELKKAQQKLEEDKPETTTRGRAV
jgi:gas vesicle protein